MLYSVLIMGMLSLPLLEWTVDLFPPAPLQEVNIDRTPPELTLRSVLDSRFQKRFETWSLQNHGLWEYLVRTNNEIDFRFFSQIDSQYGTGHSFLAGNDRSIFQSLYLRDFNGHWNRSYQDALRTARHVKRFKRFMNKRGNAVVVVISPNKLTLYPELVPERYTARHSRGTRVIDQFLRAAEQINLDVFHTTPLLQRVDPKDPYPLFALPAAHWNSVASCAVAQEILRRAARQHTGHFNQIDCSNIRIEPRPLGDDHDLMDAINIWTPSVSYRPTPYVQPKQISVPGSIEPEVLFVGTSFIWGLLDIFEQTHVYTERDFYYYSTTNHHRKSVSRNAAPVEKQHPVSYESLHWKNEVFLKDIVVLEINEARLHDLGFKFLPRVVQKIQRISERQRKKQQESLP